MEENKSEIEKIQEFIEAKKINELREYLNELNNVDISVILADLSEVIEKEKLLIAFRILT